MPGVREQGDRVDPQRGDQFEDEERGEDGGGDEHPADTGVGPVLMIVTGAHASNLCVKSHISQEAPPPAHYSQADQKRVS
ncbi:hypothetical protein MMON_41920 [Mycolicibacterium monacense]|uniref:Uncharacterized protein n=1 Tax=Mycolicibacterium monacense TaxID=85693 RepID=A0AAD1IXS7_MYCMB|nr:hypothetical protein MMON_41920 [Mycolicibacterium monacense]